MSFSDFYISRRTHKDNFLNQIDQLLDWQPIEQEIRALRPGFPCGRTAYPGLLLLKMLLVWLG
jgi:IS5 family transposase